MNRFSYAKARSFAEAGALLADGRYRLSVLKAGGMDLLDHMKEGLYEPDLVVDIRAAGGADGAPAIREEAGAIPRIRIAPTATLAQIAGSELIRLRAPALARACESAATPQVRNVATAAGNLLQRPRCWYYRNEQFHCLKKGGHTCFAVEGENQYHAVFGDGPCHIVHPSNLAPALIVLDGRVTLQGGARDSLAIAELFHMPDSGIRSEHVLAENEIITGITCAHGAQSGFYAVKEKQSFDWPLVFAAVNLEMDGDRISRAQVCAGAVAPVPWRLPNIEQGLVGVDPSDDAALRAACSDAPEGAAPMTQNAYKLTLLPVVVRRAVLRAAGLPVEDGHET